MVDPFSGCVEGTGRAGAHERQGLALDDRKVIVVRNSRLKASEVHLPGGLALLAAQPPPEADPAAEVVNANAFDLFGRPHVQSVVAAQTPTLV